MPIHLPLRLACPSAAARCARVVGRPRPGRSAARPHPFWAVACSTALLLLLASGLSGCGGSGRPCRFDDIGDHMMSTREVFLERLAGCPIGGRN